MFGTAPQVRVLTTLWLVTVLAVIAVALLALEASRTSARHHSKTAAPRAGSAVTWPRATPGSTAHVRYEYRMSLGR